MTDYIPTEEELSNKFWRLTNLYYITDKKGNQIKFNLNWAQIQLYEKEWHQMLVLKARQLGVTTYFSISFLDECFWHANTNAGIIAHRKEDAEDIFKKKVKYAYDRMPEWTRTFNSATNDRSGELAFENGSSYRVSTGFRSGTYQRLLVSEFGKICAKSPDVAKEIVTGSLNTVSSDQIIAIESTAEGREGYFYEFARGAEGLQLRQAVLSSMQMRFFFFPWFDEPDYRESSEGIIVSKETNEYLDKIELERQRKIDEEQRRWYEMKLKILGDSIKQEYPSTAKEAFESANEGLYYGFQLSKLRASGSVCRVPYDDSQPVHTAWDIGLDDFTSIWCFQVNRGGNISIINYYENWDEGAAHYCDWLNKQKYRFGRHIFPHDARKRDAGAKTQYLDHVTPLLEGKFVVLDLKECDKLEGIQTVRSILSRCVFDEERTSKGFKHLEAYKKVWDDRLGCYKNTPLHDEHSHACFIKETLISCQDCQIRIDQVKIGDKALTPNGYKTILKVYKRQTNQLLKITFGNISVICTPEHEFFSERGLTYADALRYNDVLYTQEDLQECQKLYGLKSCTQSIGFRENFLSQKMKDQLYTMVINTDLMENITGQALQKHGLSQLFIGLFGQNIKARYQKVITSTMLTETVGTIKSTIWSLFLPLNIVDCILMKKKEKLRVDNVSKSVVSWLKNGIEVILERSGIGNMPNKMDLGGMSYLCNASNATNILLEKYTINNTVPVDVKQKLDTNLELITNAESARCAKRNMNAIGTYSRKHVIETVRLNLQEPEEVYDLEIEGDHCYYANGFLVSNSDAFRYLAVGLKGLERKDKGPEDDIKAINKYYGL